MKPRLLLVIALLTLSLGASAAKQQTAVKEHGKKFFEEHKLWVFHIHLTSAAWDMMQPDRPVNRAGILGALAALGRGFGPAAPQTQPAADDGLKHREGERIRGGGFGFDFAYIKGTVEVDGVTYKDVGVRFKGNGSYSASRAVVRRPFKLDFKRFMLVDRKFHGMTQVNFANNAWDPSQLRESLTYEVYRQAGVPAPRTALAAIYLTVDGKYDREYLGCYTVVEDVDKAFLKTHFGDADGLLLKPEGARDLPYQGDDFARYTRNYRPKTPGTPQAKARLIEFVKFIHQADDNTFNEKIEQLLDVDNFLRFLATTTILSTLDTFMINGHNFYLYVDGKDNKVRWMPWDEHLSFGGFVFVGSGADQQRLSIDHPFMGDNALIQRLLAVPKYKELYHKHLRDFISGAFDPDRLYKRIDSLQQLVDQANELAKPAGKYGSPSTQPAPWGGNRNFPATPELKPFIAARSKSVLDQLAGGKDFFEPAFQGNRGALVLGPSLLPPPDLAVITSAIMRRIDVDSHQVITLAQVNLAIAQFFAQADLTKRGELDITTLTTALAKILPPPPPAPTNAARTTAKREGVLAQAILRQADNRRVGRVNLNDLQTYAARIFSQSDRNRDGALDAVELAAALRTLTSR